jgi:hypothetical protein
LKNSVTAGLIMSMAVGTICMFFVMAIMSTGHHGNARCSVKIGDLITFKGLRENPTIGDVGIVTYIDNTHAKITWCDDLSRSIERKDDLVVIHENR